MKKYTQILLFTTLVCLGACTYSRDDVAYFEASIPSLELMLELSGEQTREMINKTVDKMERISYEYSPEKINYKSKFKQLRIVLTPYHNLKVYLEEIQESISNYLQKKESHKNISSLRFIDKEYQDKIDSLVYNYVTFLEENYPKQLTSKIKSWQKQKDDFTQFQFEGLPLIGTLVQFYQIRIALEEQAQFICEGFYQEALAQNEKIKEYLHCVFAEEKNKVKLGEDYKAKVMIFSSVEVPNMKMEIAGQEVPVQNGVGKLKVKTDKLGKHSWKAKVSFRLWGRDTTFNSETLYYEVIPKK